MVSNNNNLNQLQYGRESDQEIRSNIGLVYLFSYNLLQFCGHTWIFSNMTARFLSFGLDALAGTFYFVGVMMSVCQLLSVLELFHIADEIEENRLLPRFVQVVERNFLLFLLISQSEIQSKPAVCVLFYMWNILGLLRYPYQMLCLTSTPSFNMLWVRHTIYIPVYILSVLTEGVCVLQALSNIEPQEIDSDQDMAPVSTCALLPYVLMAYITFLAAGSAVTVRILLNVKKQSLDNWKKKMM